VGLPRLRSLVHLVASLLPLAAAGSALAQEDPRVEPLLRTMTLDEKVGQMTQVDLAALKDRGDIARYFIGSVLGGGNSDPSPDNAPASWRAAAEDTLAKSRQTRLKIPIVFGVDGVHGHNNVKGAVIFPHNIGLGATRDPALVEKASRITAVELAATGIRWTFAPCVAVARDERWGRFYESFGEDPALVGEMGAAAVRGLQGTNLADPTAVLACVKHFAGDGGTKPGTGLKGGLDQGNTSGPEADLRRVHITPYAPAFRAGAGSVMASYSSWNGVRMHGNKELLTGVLKGELGFGGFVVSDWAAIDQIDRSYKEAVARAIDAGIDMAMIPYGPGQPNNYVDFITALKEHVASGRVPASRIDDAVRRILRVKARMGLLGPVPPAVGPALDVIGSPAHRAVARECVRRSLVLLKNERQALPFKKDLKRLLVCGAAADDLGVQCGGWTIAWQGAKGEVTTGGTTILAAAKAALKGGEVAYSADGSGAAGADAVLVVVGEPPYAEMEGDRTDLKLPAADQALIRRVRREAKEKPVVIVLLSGRPLILGDALESADAFVAAWLPGTEGAGVTDCLFGDAPFRGKLPHTWPRTMDQVPIGPGDADRGAPLFSYGFGLSD
jgi:beta-glucosidase